MYWLCSNVKHHFTPNGLLPSSEVNHWCIIECIIATMIVCNVSVFSVAMFTELFESVVISRLVVVGQQNIKHV